MLHGATERPSASGCSLGQAQRPDLGHMHELLRHQRHLQVRWRENGNQCFCGRKVTPGVKNANDLDCAMT